jgi:tRNA(fMet)-specific endonuclease VapC
MDYLIDTTFLIRLWRDGEASPEHAFILDHADAAVAMPWIVKGEFLRGSLVAGHDAATVQAFLGRYPTLWASEGTLLHYARSYAALVKRGKPIGPNDLWIAASALEHGRPLLSRNVTELRRVPALEVIDYAGS